MLPKTSDTQYQTIRDGEFVSECLGVNIEFEPAEGLQNEQGLPLGFLTILDQSANMEKSFEQETWDRESSSHCEVWRSIQLSRRRTDGYKSSAIPSTSVDFSEDYEMEELIPAEVIASLLPAVLLDGYVFWRTGKNVVRGYAKIPVVMRGVHAELETGRIETKPASPNSWWRGSEIYIRLLADKSGCVNAIIERVPQDFIDSDCADYDQSTIMQDLRKKEAAYAQLVRRGILLNGSFLQPGAALLKMRELLEPLQPLSAMLFWTTATPTDEELRGESWCSDPRLPISFVEMPRLGLTFNVEQIDAGENVRVCCVERSGFSVVALASMELSRQQQMRRLTDGMEGFLILEDDVGNIELVVTQRRLFRQQVKGAPFHTGSLPPYAMGKRGVSDINTYIVFPVHPCGAYLMISSTLARLYLIYARLFAHRYEDASNLIDGLFYRSSEHTDAETDLVDSIAKLSALRTADAVVCMLKFAWRTSDDAGRLASLYSAYSSVKDLVAETLLLTREVEAAIVELVGESHPAAVSGSTVRAKSVAAATSSGNRIGDLLRVRASAAAELIRNISITVVPTSGELNWKPKLNVIAESVTDTAMDLRWDVQPSADSEESLRRVVYFTAVCSASLKPASDETDSAGGDSKGGSRGASAASALFDVAVGQWVLVKSLRYIGMIGSISDSDDKELVDYTVHFPGVSIPVEFVQPASPPPPGFTAKKSDLEPWEVSVTVFLGAQSTAGHVSGLRPEVSYAVQFFACTADGARSEIESSIITTNPTVDKEMDRSQFATGCKVEVNYNDSGQWYVGTISQDRGNGTFDISYSKLPSERRVKKSNIRSLVGRINEGTKVAAQRTGSSDVYKGKVSSVATDEEGDVRYDILYDNGETESDMSIDMLIQVFADEVKEDARVVAKFQGKDEWLAGTVTKNLGDGTFDIIYDSGDKETAVKREFIAVLSPEASANTTSVAVKIQVGSRFEVNYRGRGYWKPGEITQTRDDGSYDIRYDDGDREQGVKLQMIALMTADAADGWRETSQTPDDLLRSRPVCSEPFSARYIRYRRARKTDDFTFNRDALKGSEVTGVHAQQWATKCFRVAAADHNEHFAFSNTYLDAYEVLSGEVIWSLTWDESTETKDNYTPAPVFEPTAAADFPVGCLVEVAGKSSEVDSGSDLTSIFKSGKFTRREPGNLCSVKLSDGNVKQFPLTAITKEACFPPWINAWRCSFYTCGKINDGRAFSCARCCRPFPLHDCTRVAKEEEEAVSANDDIFKFDYNDESQAFGIFALLCRIYSCLNRCAREHVTFFPSINQPELEALMVVVYFTTQAAAGSLQQLSKEERAEAGKFMSQLPTFPYDDDMRPLHEQGHFTFTHGAGFAFYRSLIDLALEILDSRFWSTIHSRYISLSEKRLVNEDDDQSVCLLTKMRTQSIFSDENCFQQVLSVIPVGNCIDQASLKPLAILADEASSLQNLSKICQRLLQLEALKGRDSVSIGEDVGQLELKLEAFLSKEEERYGSDCTAAEILKDMKANPLEEEVAAAETADFSNPTLVTKSVDYSQINGWFKKSTTMLPPQLGMLLEWLFGTLASLLVKTEGTLQEALIQLRESIHAASSQIKSLGNGTSDRAARLLHLAERKRIVSIEDLVRGLLSTSMEDDLISAGVSNARNLVTLTSNIVFGTILTSHVTRCIREVRSLKQEIDGLQQDFIKLYFSRDKPGVSVESLARTGLLQRSLTDARECVGTKTTLEQVLEIMVGRQSVAVELLRRTIGRSSPSLDEFTGFDVMLSINQFDTKALESQLQKMQTGLNEEKICDLAKRGMCIGGRCVSFDLTVGDYTGSSDYTEDIRKRLLLVQHMSDRVAELLSSQHSIVQKQQASKLPTGLSSAAVNPQFLVFEFLTGFMLFEYVTTDHIILIA